jgi:hypothetical protein
MIKQLHPTLKKCKCHYIGTKRELYKHFDQVQRRMKVFGEPAREFFVAHGEVPLNVDDPRLNLESQLEQSLCICRDKKTNPDCKHPFCVAYRKIEPYIIPSGHRLDDNNTEIPTV